MKHKEPGKILLLMSNEAYGLREDVITINEAYGLREDVITNRNEAYGM